MGQTTLSAFLRIELIDWLIKTKLNLEHIGSNQKLDHVGAVCSHRDWPRFGWMRPLPRAVCGPIYQLSGRTDLWKQSCEVTPHIMKSTSLRSSLRYDLPQPIRSQTAVHGGYIPVHGLWLMVVIFQMTEVICSRVGPRDLYASKNM